MARSRHVLRSSEIPQTGELFFEFAEVLNGSPLPRDLHVTAIEKTPVHGKIELVHDSHKQELNALALLKTIRDIKTYRGDTFPVSRTNSRVAARVGGAAALGISRLVPAQGLTGDALEGISNSLLTIHGKLEHSFKPIARPLANDKDALDILMDLKQILTGTRKNT